MLSKPNVADIDFESALRLKAKHLPSFLYRYRKIGTDGYTMASLTSGETWLSAPDKLNDPFDCALLFSAEMMGRTWHKTRLEDILDATGHRAAFTDAEIADIKASDDPMKRLAQISFAKEGQPMPDVIDRLLAELPSAILGESLNNLAVKSRDSLRICCFSEDPSSILMWSHYTEDHKGLCLEYDLTAWMSTPAFRILHPVHYTDTRFDATEHLNPGYETNPYLSTAAACNKAKDWAYEREWRIVVPAGILNAKPSMKLGGLARIIVGTKADPDMEARLRSIPSIQHVPIVRAKLSPKYFSVVIDQPIHSTGSLKN